MNLRICLVLMVFASCGETKKPQEIEPEKSAVTNFFVGTYTRGDSKGIYRYALNEDGTLDSLGLAAEEENPSFLAKSTDGNFLLAVNEIRDENGGGGTVASFAINGNNLEFKDRKPSGGDSPCYVGVDEEGNVLTANYHSGTVALLELAADGSLKGPLDIQKHMGAGTTDRQKGPHAHSAWFDEDGSVISVDLGTNELWFSKINDTEKKLEPQEQVKLPMDEGAGPRHLSFHPDGKWAYVINELSSTVSQIGKDENDNYQILNSYSTLPPDYEGENSCADIHASSDGKYLYASNRGHNSIAIYSINQASGELEWIGSEPVRGDWPRNFSISPDGTYLLVANQRSNNIVSFKRNTDGRLQYLAEVEAPSPVCILF